MYLKGTWNYQFFFYIFLLRFQNILKANFLSNWICCLGPTDYILKSFLLKNCIGFFDKIID